MNHGSLFSGIGGFDLAAEWAGWNNTFHCEWNPFGQKVLKHHFPNSISYNDITKTNFSIHEGNIDILSGGFPCQPYSTAGLRKGKEDERHLWPQMLRAIREIKPSWVVGENVRGLINWGGGWYSTRCKLTWKLKGTKYSRYYFQLAPSTHHTDETEFGLLLTPTTIDIKPNANRFQKRTEYRASVGRKWSPGNLTEQVFQMLPTPTATDYKGAYSENAMISKNGIDRSALLRNVYILTNQTWKQEDGTTSQLNPHFVEEMMGFPKNWTALPFLNGKMNQSKHTETQ